MIDLVHTHLPRLAAPFLPHALWRVRTAERVCFLTFDDGPTPHTPALLDLLDRHGARAVHFLIGARAERHPMLVRSLIDRGHALGNHTYHHADAWRTRPGTVQRELEQTTALIEDLSGQPLHWVRPPYGHLTPGYVTWSRTTAQRLALWDVMPADFRHDQSAEAIAARCSRLVRPGSLLVFHDTPPCAERTHNALSRLLPRLTADGWRFGLLDHTAPTA